MPDISLFMLFLAGFLGGVHCAAMCGPLTGAFIFQLPEKTARIPLVSAMNIGRIASYSFIGFLLGLLGQIGIGLDSTHILRYALLILAQIILLLMGLYLAGAASWIVRVESLGKPLWRRLNPLLGKFLPVRSVGGALAVGALWGWLPCGLVYSASTYALGSGSAVRGALIMLCFGLGTLPNLMAMGWFAAESKKFFQKKMLRIIVGCLMTAWAVYQLFLIVRLLLS